MLRVHVLSFIVLSALTFKAGATDCRANLDPHGQLFDPELVHYVQTGDLVETLVIKAQLSKFLVANEGRRFYAQRDAIYQAVLGDLETISQALERLSGKPKDQCPFEKNVGNAGYTFKRQDYIGRHVITINRARDNFYWTIGVNYEGNFWEQGNKVDITGYHHIGTNGNLADMTEALEATQDFFPEVHRQP